MVLLKHNNSDLENEGNRLQRGDKKKDLVV